MPCGGAGGGEGCPTGGTGGALVGMPESEDEVTMSYCSYYLPCGLVG